MGNLIDMIGRKYHRLTVKRRALNDSQGSAYWLCVCDCGVLTKVKGSSLRHGRIKSCGCLQLELVIKNNKLRTTHGESKKTPEYSTWAAMKNRCLNSNNNAYKYYGGRGISVCDRWLKFEHFLEDMGRKPTAKHSIERIENNKGYYPDNCKWATMEEQCNNQRKNRILEYKNKKQSLSAWAREKNINRETLRDRLKCGWSVHDALTKRVRPLKRKLVS